MSISIVIAKEEHFKYAHDTIEQSALMRGNGIAKRTPEYIPKKMESKDAVIALDNGNLAGFLHRKLAGKQLCSSFWFNSTSRLQKFRFKIKSKVFDYS
jgi:hypothetical protein